MKSRISFILFIMLVTWLTVPGTANAQGQSVAMKGAWETRLQENRVIMICSEKYFAVATYLSGDGKFVETHGGSYRMAGNVFIADIAFHSTNPELVGKEVRTAMEWDQQTLRLKDRSQNVEWKRVDDGTPGKLAGSWLITGRMLDGTIRKVTPGASRTMKILSGTRFQWIAYNLATKKILATGGGNYTTGNGKYAEHIEFFSKDSSRVGKTLTFDFSIQDGNWLHRGISSKGESMEEVWARRETSGL